MRSPEHGAAERVAPRDIPRAPWRVRALDAVSAYLPVLLMALLALGTWWLVKNTPMFENDRVPVTPRHEPDYTMSEFTVQRFGADGALRAQIEGETLRHYPDTDTLEIDNPKIRAIDDSGRVTLADSRSAWSNRDGSEVELRGDAHIVREATEAEDAIDFRGEFLHYFEHSERVQSHLPVVVTQAGNTFTADAIRYDHRARVLDLGGRVRAVLAPGPRVRR